VLSWLTAAALVVSLGAPPETPESLLKRGDESMRSARSVTGTVEVAPPGNRPPMIFQFKLLKPNLFQIIGQNQAWYHDGTTIWMHMIPDKQYQKMKSQEIRSAPMLMGFEPFFQPKTPVNVPEKVEESTFGDKKAVAAALKAVNGVTQQTLFYDPETGLPVGAEIRSGQSVVTYRIKGVKLNEDLKPEIFAWQPPAGVKEFVFSGGELLNEGAQAPNFTVKAVSGKEVSLAETLKKNKAVLINFWFYG
jgi:outer membrane lipoprotein-sorting protein